MKRRIALTASLLSAFVSLVPMGTFARPLIAPQSRSPQAYSVPHDAGKVAQYLDVYNTGSPGIYPGQYVRYSLPNLTLLQTTQADGVGSPMAFNAKRVPYFVDESPPSIGNFGLYEQPIGMKVVPAVFQFGGVPCQSSSLSIGPNGDFYVNQYCSNSVLEFKPGATKGGKPKKPIAIYTGGNLGSTEHPTYAVVDHKGNLYVGDSGGGVTYFPHGSTTGTVILQTGRSQPVTQMVVDKNGDVWSIHLGDPTPVYFADDTTCVPDPSGHIVRTDLAEHFSQGQFVQQLYTTPTDISDAVNEGVSIAVDSQLRVYAGSFYNGGSSFVLDYDPGQSCPDVPRTIVLAHGADPQVAVDSKRRLYVTDQADNTIASYKSGSTKPIAKIAQATGIVTPTYAGIPQM
ncbi:MAG: hypothetical protein JO043_07615 [Candidatus Eremiobacteraeota bacterium]|nr:hypothetical protein [Candidatus Eremiobacteraeota bacterium]